MFHGGHSRMVAALQSRLGVRVPSGERGCEGDSVPDGCFSIKCGLQGPLGLRGRLWRVILRPFLSLPRQGWRKASEKQAPPTIESRDPLLSECRSGQLTVPDQGLSGRRGTDAGCEIDRQFDRARKGGGNVRKSYRLRRRSKEESPSSEIRIRADEGSGMTIVPAPSLNKSETSWEVRISPS